MLQAIRVASRMEYTSDGRHLLLVPRGQVERVRRELGEYEQENRQRYLEHNEKDTALYEGTWWAAAIVLMLAAFFAITGPVANRSIWFGVGIADTNAILSGAIYQTVTALTLHSTVQHLVGNVVVGGVFFAIVHKRFGAGLGSLLILLSGALGNYANALWHWTDHRSLGASTAVMGAVGIVAATQFVFNRAKRPTTKALLTWTPLMGGAALLATFGASSDSDILAHGFGFVAGLALGLVAAYPLRHRQTSKPLWLRGLFGTTAAAIIVISWALALTFGPVT